MTEFLRGFFSQPAMLAGLALVAVPIIIHLIHRQRFQRRKWAAMEFLLRALQKNQRRIQLENLLLLILRCAVLALLAAAMARPFLRSRVLGSLSDRPENWILAIDTSYSMEWKSGARSLFEIACETVTQMVQSVIKPGDRLAITTLEANPQVIQPPRQLTETGRGEISRGIAELKTTYQPVNLPASLQKILDVARQFEPVPESAVPLSGKKLILFSDFQRRDWLGESGPKDPAVNDLLREIQEAGVAVSRADLKGSDRNLTMTDLAMTPPLASQEMWVQFTATARNYGKEDFDAVEVIFYIDGVEERTYVTPVPAGGLVSRSLPYRFTTPGSHTVTAEVRGDSLVMDNRRYLAVGVRDNAEVLLVNGEPGSQPLESETLLLELALMPEEADEFRQAPYHPASRTVEQILSDGAGLKPYLAVILANVSAGDLPARFLDELRKFVSGGGGLLVFLGKNVIPEDYNQAFHRSEDDLLPIPLAVLQNSDGSPVHLRIPEEDHPVARYFLERREFSYLESAAIEFRRFFRFQPPAEESAEKKSPARIAALLRFTDGEDSLAVFDNAYGQGRAMWFASTADLEWNDFPRYPDFIPFLHESLPYLVRFGEGRINLSLGEPFRYQLDASEFAKSILITPPAGPSSGAPTPVPKELEKLSDENRFVLVHEETRQSGVYQIRLQRPAPGEGDSPERLLHFAVNLDAGEGDLRAASADELRDNFPEFKAVVFDAAKEIQEIARLKSTGGGTEYWRHLLWLVAALLVAEMVLAHWFGKGVK
ncbi:MAG: BatA domain-containing protein [Planctomycetes bacterium]|nr:BatA domain-containing protein [Planctomycetota bacterium]